MFEKIIVFLAMCLVDVCWALYSRRSAQGRAFQAGLFSAGIAVFSGFTTIMVVSDNLNIIPVAIAAWLATWATVHIDHKRG